jgi:hypothetical protein
LSLNKIRLTAVILFYSIHLTHCFVFITLGIGRQVQRIEDIPYTCKQIRSLLLESCEAMWLDEEGRRLYAACSIMTSRGGWGRKQVTSSIDDKIMFILVFTF